LKNHQLLVEEKKMKQQWLVFDGGDNVSWVKPAATTTTTTASVKKMTKPP
jgi:hypothetical protein